MTRAELSRLLASKKKTTINTYIYNVYHLVLTISLFFFFFVYFIFAVVIMCADPQSIRQIMLTAEELNMIDSGEYVFINIELFSRWVSQH